ncbi:hypothetical protein FOZG_15809 [Fusarium oxysporum Fo47]|uniref:Uncharacterized protein n=1 Tax=Fusarium oxysporum Fo47 TaxID=660027 RepID=W9JLS0_FUSOX|nr:hypothetical protein FOZG_15809 [Fusarium oxysporum Fo47]
MVIITFHSMKQLVMDTRLLVACFLRRMILASTSKMAIKEHLLLKLLAMGTGL